MDELAERIEIALAQSKKVEREARNLKQMLGGIHDLINLQPEKAQGEPNATSSKEQ